MRHEMNKGIFITFEGPDGAGKTSVLQALLPRLEEFGKELVTTREPGGSGDCRRYPICDFGP